MNYGIVFLVFRSYYLVQKCSFSAAILQALLQKWKIPCAPLFAPRRRFHFNLGGFFENRPSPSRAMGKGAWERSYLEGASGILRQVYFLN
jgi:hypothetical protein